MRRGLNTRPRLAYHLVTNVYHEGEAIGGIETHMVTLAAATEKAGFEVHAILPDSTLFAPLVRELQEVGVTTHRLTPIKSRPLRRLPGSLRRLSTLLHEQEVDVLHIQRSVPTQGKWSAVAARTAGVPVVLASDHGLPDPPRAVRQQINRASDRLLDRVIVVSEFSRRKQIDLLGRPAALVQTIYNGIDTAAFAFAGPEQRAAARTTLNLPVEAPVIGIVARLEIIKGVDDLLRAAARLIERWPALHIVIAGNGTQRHVLESKAMALGINQRVHFLGKYPDVALVMRALDVFVLPTRLETFGLVAAEAMAVGTPVVTTNIMSLPEVVAHGETGLLVAPGDSAALLAAVDQLLSDDALRRRMGQAGRARVEQLFSSQVMAERTAALYNQLLDAKAVRA